MTTTEHLSLIESHLRKLLAIAKKHSGGDWVAGNDSSVSHFIADCAGNAEAGWKSALVSITFFMLIKSSYARLTAAHCIADDAIANIIAAYPIELLK